MPMMAPAATMISEASHPRVRVPISRWPTGPGNSGNCSGRATLPANRKHSSPAFFRRSAISGNPSRQKATSPPMIPDSSSALALAIATAPAVCNERSVSAVAIPSGKGSFSTLMSCRFSGTAMNTPSTETAASQAIISGGRQLPSGR